MPENENKPAFYPARPDVYVDGQLEPQLGASDPLTVLVEQSTEGLFRCELRLSNWGVTEAAVDFLHLDRQVLDFGRELAIELGAPGSRIRVFDGRITALEAQLAASRAPELVVLAEDRFQDLRMSRRTRTWENVSDADVFTQIASDHSLQPEVDVDGVQHALLAQLGETDLAFLRRRASAVGAEVWVEEGALHVQPRSRRNHGTVELTYGRNLIAASLTADVAHQRTHVRATGWDVGAKRGVSVDAGESALQGELEGSDGGATTLTRALGSRTDVLTLQGARTQDEARALAESTARRRGRRFLSGRLEVDGEAGMRVGGRVDLAGVGAPFAGVWAIRGLRHTFDLKSGFRTMAEVERPWIGGAA